MWSDMWSTTSGSLIAFFPTLQRRGNAHIDRHQIDRTSCLARRLQSHGAWCELSTVLCSRPLNCRDVSMHQSLDMRKRPDMRYSEFSYHKQAKQHGLLSKACQSNVTCNHTTTANPRQPLTRS